MKVALVVQRYGVEVLGGAETLARRIAELIAPRVDLEVLTTCAVDYLTWADHYPAGATEVNGVRVLRFEVPVPRNEAAFEPTHRRRTSASVAPGWKHKAQMRQPSSSTFGDTDRPMTPLSS